MHEAPLWQPGIHYPVARRFQGRSECLGSGWLVIGAVRLCKPSRTIQPRLVRSISRRIGADRGVGMIEDAVTEPAALAKLVGSGGLGCPDAEALASPM